MLRGTIFFAGSATETHTISRLYRSLPVFEVFFSGSKNRTYPGRGMHSQILPWNDLESHDLLDSQIFSYRPFIRDHFRLRQDTSQLTHFLGFLRCWKFGGLIRPGQWSLSRKLLVSWQIWPTLLVWKPKDSHMRSPFHALTPGRQCKKCILFISSFVMFCLMSCCFFCLLDIFH